MRFLSNICEVNHEGDWCCFMPACGKHDWWPPVIPLVALIDVVDRKSSGLSNNSQRCTFHTLPLIRGLQRVGREQLLPLCLSYPLVCPCRFIFKDLILLPIAEPIPVVPQPVLIYTPLSLEAQWELGNRVLKCAPCCCIKTLYCGGGKKRDIFHA